MADLSCPSDLGKQLQMLSSRLSVVEQVAAANLAAHIRATIKLIASLLANPVTASVAVMYLTDPSVIALFGMMTGDVTMLLDDPLTAALAILCQTAMAKLTLKSIALPAFPSSLMDAATAALNAELASAEGALAAGIAAALPMDQINALRSALAAVQDAIHSANSVVDALNRVPTCSTLSARFSAGNS